jgi:hypothetical protein
MVLTKGDDYPLHQTPEPVAYAGTDRNFYDRYFFNGYAPDGRASSPWPSVSIRTLMWDAHFCVRDGVQHCLHASRSWAWSGWICLRADPDRNPGAAPPKLRVIVDGEGLKADLTFTGRAFPIEEPRFTTGSARAPSWIIPA